MGMGRFKPGCNCGCDEVCISLKSYKFLCCEQRTYIYVSSPCAIDEIRVNGTVIANPGTNEYGGLPASAPVISIDGEDVTGVFLASQQCGSCPPEVEQQATPPTSISVSPVNCRYDVEVDTCGTTYYCSLSYCLPRILTLYDLSFSGLSLHFECSDDGFSPIEQPNERSITYDFSFPSLSFGDIQIDFCVANEDPTTISGPTITITETEVEVSTLSGTHTRTTTWSGSLSILISPYLQCRWYFNDDDPFTDDGGIYLLFTGTATTVETGPTVPGGSQTSTTTLTNHIIGTGIYGVCDGGASAPAFAFQLTIGSASLGLAPIGDGDETLVCQYSGRPLITLGNYSWCG